MVTHPWIETTERVVTMQMKTYRWLRTVSSFLHKTQQKTLLAITVAVCRSGCLRSFSVAHVLAEATKVKCKSALQRFYRFIHKSKIDNIELWAEITHRLLIDIRGVPVVSIDWTEWRFDLRVLSAALSVGRRALPLFVQTFTKSPPRSQNSRENTFIQMLLSLSPPVQQSSAFIRPWISPRQLDPAFGKAQA